MSLKERSQTPLVGDTIRLRKIFLNGNTFADPFSVNSVDIYVIDPTAITVINTTGTVLLESLDISSLVRESIGNYYIDLPTTSPKYTISSYVDSWNVNYGSADECDVNVEDSFALNSDKWTAIAELPVYAFEFGFSPNRVRKGSVVYLQIDIKPSVPNATSLDEYYENLILDSSVTLSISQRCGVCLPCEEDLRIIVDEETLTQTGGNKVNYLLDTSENGLDLDIGVYDLWTTLAYLDTVHVSPKMQLLIY